MTRTCIVNNDFRVHEMLSSLALSRARSVPPFEHQLAAFLDADTILPTSCGFAALEIILASLHDTYPDKHEVIIPAYAAPGLVLPIRRRGLTPVLCDISLETFTIDPARMGSVVSPATLAVVAVDLFGIPADVPSLRTAAGPDVTIIDDCAQALGSERAGIKAGMLGDIGFGSFGRGKNFSVYAGGFICLGASPLADAVRNHFTCLPRSSASDGVTSSAKHILFSVMTSPGVYQYTAPALARIKSTREQQAYSAARMNALTTGSARTLFPSWRAVYQARIHAGNAYRELMIDDDGLLTPAMPQDCRIAFNRFPVIVKHTGRRAALMTQLVDAGIDASPFYGKPVHLLHDVAVHPLGYPAAEYCAEHLITLPAHGQVSQEDVGRVADIFRASQRNTGRDRA